MSFIESVTTPLRFGTIEPNLFRGSYPTLRHFRFLRRLKIKTIISITPEPPTKDLMDFCGLFNIAIEHIQV
jgi:tyrosine-protein phosphatase OCA6